MAKPKLKYVITSKDESRAGIDSAKKNVSGLAAAGVKGAAKMALKYAAVALSIKAVSSVMQKSLKLFAEQEKTEIRLAAAAKNNPLINGAAVKSLKAYASALQKTSIFGDEAIIQQESFLTTLGLSEDQIKGVMTAAVDLASTGMVSLESAVKNISKTYGGMTGELGELIPQLKNLTVEELKSGKAVEYITKTYEGMAEAVAGTSFGQMEQIKNQWGDMLEGIGKGIAPLLKNTLTTAKPIIDNISAWLAENVDKITNFFLHFPSIVSASMTLIENIMKKTFTLDYIKTAFEAVWNFAKNQTINGMTYISDLIKNVAKFLWEPIKYGLELAGYGIKSVWRGIIEGLVVALNFIMTPINAIIAGLETIATAGKKILGAKAADFGRIEIAKPAWAADLEKPGGWGDRGDKMVKALIGVKDGYVKHFKETVGALKVLGQDISEPFAAEFAEFSSAFEKIVTQDLPEHLRSPVAALEAALGAGGGDGAGGGPGIAKIIEAGFQPLLLALQAMTSELFTVTQKTEEEGGGLQLDSQVSSFPEMLNTAIPIFAQLFGQIGSITALLNPFTTIFTAIIKVLTPVVNQLLAPLVGMFVIMGETIGKLLIPILLLLHPVIELIAAAFILTYNYAIMPFANAVIFVLNVIYNMVAFIWNAIASAINFLLGWLGVRLKKMQTRSMTSGFLGEISSESLTESGEEGTEGAAAAAASAVYTGGKVINIAGIYIYTDALVGPNGGFDQLAMAIDKSIKRSEEIGWVA